MSSFSGFRPQTSQTHSSALDSSTESAHDQSNTQFPPPFALQTGKEESLPTDLEDEDMETEPFAPSSPAPPMDQEEFNGSALKKNKAEVLDEQSGNLNASQASPKFEVVRVLGLEDPSPVFPPFRPQAESSLTVDSPEGGEEELEEEEEDLSEEELWEELKGVSVEINVARDQPKRTAEQKEKATSKNLQQINVADYYKRKARYNFPGELMLVALKKELQSVQDAESKNPSDLGALRVIALEWLVLKKTPVPRKTQSGGGGWKAAVTIEGKNLSIGGRPGFDSAASGLKGMQPKMNRRHVIPWHAISQALQNIGRHILSLEDSPSGKTAVEALGEWSRKLYVQLGIKEELEAKEQSKTVKSKNSKKAEIPDPANLKGEKAVTKLLGYVVGKLNSNVQNLWPGDGYENQKINGFRKSMEFWRARLKAHKGSEVDFAQEMAQSFRKGIKGKPKQYGDILETGIGMLEVWAKTRKDELDQKVPDEKRQSIKLDQMILDMSNTYEVDFPFANDREYVAKHGNPVSNGLLPLSTSFLELADQTSKDFKETDLEQAVQNLDDLVQKFLSPKDVPAKKKEKESDSMEIEQ